MRFRYSTADPAQNGFDSLPRVPMVLRCRDRVVEVVGLVDSGATVNVLHYELGTRLGEVWDDRKANIRLAGIFGNRTAMPLFAVAEIEGLPAVKLAFAWTKQNDMPLILGQTNFFLEFDVCFYRSKLEFELKPKSI